MFTGLIEHLGTVASIVVDAGGCTLTIADSAPILGDCHIGDSIAVNGACLTVTEFDSEKQGGWFKVWLANETLERTDLGERKEGDQVNLERAMGAHVRFGGHFVQAHVDTTATVVERSTDGDSLRLKLQLPEATAERPSLLPYLIPKGYVTIDGASLTLTAVDDTQRTFEIMLIQHTQQKITLSKKEIGEKVNIEVDMVGKYVEKSVVAALGGRGGDGIRALVEKVVEESGLGRQVGTMAEPTLKRKVTVKLTTANKVSTRPATSARPVTSPTPRPPSPTKPVRPTTLSPTFQPKARSHLKPANSENRSRSHTTVGRFTPELRARHGSVSLHHAVSFSSLNLSSAPTPSVDSSAHSDTEGRYSPSPSVRIKSKVSRLAKPPADSLSPPPSRVGTPRNRAPSTSSTTSPPSATPTFYPITTATSAANPHRYPTARSPPHPAHHYYQSSKRLPRVDPATIPLPANSPPASAVSFSSRSSVSLTAESADSHAATHTTSGDNDRLRSTLHNLLMYTEMNNSREDTCSGDSGHDRETDSELVTDARKVKAEAKSNRKIADLEITNRSLLAINASLESAKHKQAKEIRDLRRKLRESRLILPPRAYRAVKDPEPEDDDDDDENDDELEDDGKDGDEVYQRIKLILEGLLDSGRRALERNPKDFPEAGAKVLSAEEVRSWRGVTSDPTEETAESHVPLSPSHIAVPDSESDVSFGSEDEVEMTLTSSLMMLPSPSPPGPPILITDSH
ncbi:hypothetical protein D9615_001232 [Tricholomella constricta]|uniref:Riboflavin synthase n=1 Tax=Tricholomella constricta TaxID=117010 RepID=A0A8H5HKH5_9AGAR|nr:hypothetical protein D9615_001232 [Tricholomella constricta]